MSGETVRDVGGIPFKEGLFAEATDSGAGPRLVGTRCAVCGMVAFPRRIVCSRCNAVGKQDEVLLGPHGRLYTFAVVRQAPERFPTPYVIGYVDLDEGVRVFTQIETEAPDSLQLGQRMRLTIGELDRDAEGRPRLAYRFRGDAQEDE